jgi:type IV secretory pathway VirB10-like protein
VTPTSIPFSWSKENFEQQAGLLRQGVSMGALLKGNQNLTTEEQRAFMMGKDIGRPVQRATKEEIESLIESKRKELFPEPPQTARPASPQPPPNPPAAYRPLTEYEAQQKESWDRQSAFIREQDEKKIAARNEAMRQAEIQKKADEQRRVEEDRELMGYGYYNPFGRSFGRRGSDPIFEMDRARALSIGRQNKAASEANIRAKSVWDTAMSDVAKAEELAGQTKAPGAMAGEVIGAGSLAQKGIAGGSQAGRTLAGEFKSPYQVGSILPASWMRNLDETKVAQKASGLSSREEGPKTQKMPEIDIERAMWLAGVARRG